MTEQPGPPRGAPIGHDVYVRYYSRGDVPMAGLIENHLTADGRRCEGAVTFDLPVNDDLKARGNAVWKVEQWLPLTLSPSLKCRECGHHGYIREGRWEPA